MISAGIVGAAVAAVAAVAAAAAAVVAGHLLLGDPFLLAKLGPPVLEPDLRCGGGEDRA